VSGALEAILLDALRQRLDDFDLVHCHAEFMHAALLADANVATLTTVHWRVDQLDRRLFFEYFNRLPVAAISQSQADDLPAGNLAGVVLHGIAEDRYVAGSGEGEYLAFLGRLNDKKRLDRAIEISQLSGIPLKIAGATDAGNSGYFESAVEPNLNADITYIGEIKNAEKQSFLGSAAALLLPRDWPEPFGLIMLEAMACGTPVIAWNRGSATEIIEHGVTGFIVNSVAEAAVQARAARQLDRQRIRARFEVRFSAAQMASNYESIYAELIQRRATPAVTLGV